MNNVLKLTLGFPSSFKELPIVVTTLNKYSVLVNLIESLGYSFSSNYRHMDLDGSIVSRLTLIFSKGDNSVYLIIKTRLDGYVYHSISGLIQLTEITFSDTCDCHIFNVVRQYFESTKVVPVEFELFKNYMIVPKIFLRINTRIFKDIHFQYNKDDKCHAMLPLDYFISPPLHYVIDHVMIRSDLKSLNKTRLIRMLILIKWKHNKQEVYLLKNLFEMLGENIS